MSIYFIFTDAFSFVAGVWTLRMAKKGMHVTAYVRRGDSDYVSLVFDGREVYVGFWVCTALFEKQSRKE